MRCIKILLTSLLTVALMCGTALAAEENDIMVFDVDGSIQVYGSSVLEFDTKLPSTAIGSTDYNTQLSIKDGSGTYKWTFLSGNMPKGLVFTEDGRLTVDTTAEGWLAFGAKGKGGGMITSGGTYNFYVKVEDNLGNSAVQIVSIDVEYKRATITLSNDRFNYDGNVHTATVTKIDAADNNLVAGTDFTISYQDINSLTTTDTPTDVGTYKIIITPRTSFYAKGYILSSYSPQFLFIDYSKNNSLTLSSKTVTYDGSTKPMDDCVTITPSSLANYYKLSYSGTTAAGADYAASSTPPTEAGSYTVVATATHPNYQPKQAIATLLIEPKGISFNVSNLTVAYDKTQATAGFAPTVTTTDTAIGGAVFDEFELTYVNAAGQTISKVTSPGTYYYTISCTNPNYTPAGTNVGGEFNVTAPKVNFTTDDKTEVVYDGTAKSLNFSPSGISEVWVQGTDYFVTYWQGEGDSRVQVTNPTNVGTYDIVITLADEKPYEVGEYTNKLVILKEPTIELEPGNSIYNKMTEEEKALYQTALTYKGIFYTSNAWDGENLDKSETAYFVVGFDAMKSFKCTDLPGCKAYDSDGKEVSVTVTIDGKSLAEWQKIYDTDPWFNVNIYTVTYEAADIGKKAERKLVILPDLGDVNFDGNINVGDVRAMKENIKSSITGLALRYYDVNHDGIVTEDDVLALQNRFNTPITPYYK